MKTKQLILTFAVLTCLSALNPQLSATPLGRAFTYQGRLNDGGAPANGSYDLTFTLYDSASGPTVINMPLTNAATAVSNGLFTVTLDCGPGAFTGDARWLEIAVRTNGSSGDFVTLSPRQALTATPYARYASSAGTATTAGTATIASSVSAGAVDNAALQAGAVDSSRIAAGAITTTNLSPALLSNTFWRLDGNSGTTAGTQFVGTADNQPLELKVDGQRALRLEPNAGGAPNVIGGWSENYAGPGVSGAVIAGGGNPALAATNSVLGSLSAIGGGANNTINAQRAVIAGGVANNIDANSTGAAIGGGTANNIQFSSAHAHIGGGFQNIIQGPGSYGTIGGGFTNTIQAGAFQATIGGGAFNLINGGSQAGTISGGSSNVVGFYAPYSAIPGGRLNEANGENSLAAGRQAKANHPGAFVWADDTEADFTSTSSNQFLIRAGGGVGIGTNSPQSALHVAGVVTADSFSGNGAGLTGIPAAALPAVIVTNGQAGVNFSGTFNAAAGLVIENRTSDPPSPAVGQIWLRTDL